MYRISPFSYAYNCPIAFIDHHGNEPVLFGFIELRGIAPIIGELGLTASFNAALYFEIGSTFRIGAGTTTGAGIGLGKGMFLGSGVGYNGQVDKMEDLNGVGVNVGVVYAAPSGSGSLELNMAFPNGAGDPKYGLSGSVPGLPLSTGLGYGGYAEVSATNIKETTIDEFIDNNYGLAIDAIDMAIVGAWKMGPLGWTKLDELYEARRELKLKMEHVKEDLHTLKSEIEESYNSLGEDERKAVDSGSNTSWSEHYQFILSCILAGVNVTFK